MQGLEVLVGCSTDSLHFNTPSFLSFPAHLSGVVLSFITL